MENELAELLGYARFDFVKRLLHNRKTIVACTQLAQAQTDQEKYVLVLVGVAVADGEQV